jgi:hypothetical protein
MKQSLVIMCRLGAQGNLPRPVGKYTIDASAEVLVRDLWSISLYNARGFYEKNDLSA